LPLYTLCPAPYSEECLSERERERERGREREKERERERERERDRDREVFYLMMQYFC